MAKRGRIGDYSRKRLNGIIENKHNSLGSEGGVTNPAGSDTQIQFNDGGSFGASANLTFDGTNVEITGALSVSGNIGVGISAGAITHAITLPDNADTTGKIKANAYLTYSSERFKTDVNIIEKPIETIQNLRGVTFTWKKNNQKDYGFIAEEVGAELPVIVEWDEESPKDNPRAMSMDYTRIIPILLEGIKSQQKQIDDLKQEIKLLKSND